MQRGKEVPSRGELLPLEKNLNPQDSSPFWPGLSLGTSGRTYGQG